MNAVLRAIAFSFVIVAHVLFAPQAAANPKYAAHVVHADSGDILFSRYADELRYPASLTKVMTLYLLFEEIEAGRLSLDSKLTVSAQAAGQPPSKLGLTAGSTIDVETAIKALVVKSANDVAVVVAEGVSGSEWRFAQRMTEKAKALGMKRTTFRNASGLPNPKQQTTARDLATLGQRVIHDFPQYYHYFSTEKFTWNGRSYLSHNAVARHYDGAEGLKTGYTRVSGFNLATSASRDGNRLVGIVLGGRSVQTRDAHMREILTASFARIKEEPSLIASLHRSTPEPRLKPTLVAERAARQAAPAAAPAPAVAALAAPPADDPLAALIAASSSVTADLNLHQQARLAALDTGEEASGEGDADSAFTGAQNWNVQIGAYMSKALAQSELEAAANAVGLTERTRAVQPITGLDGRAMYRARFTSLSAADAGEICDSLRGKGRACFVISEPAAQ